MTTRFDRAGLVVLIGTTMWDGFPLVALVIYLLVAIYILANLYARMDRRRDEVIRQHSPFYVMCVTIRDQSRGFLWSGPYETEAEAHEEIVDSRSLVGRRDSLYVVDRRSYPPSSG